MSGCAQHVNPSSDPCRCVTAHCKALHWGRCMLRHGSMQRYGAAWDGMQGVALPCLLQLQVGVITGFAGPEASGLLGSMLPSGRAGTSCCSWPAFFDGSLLLTSIAYAGRLAHGHAFACLYFTNRPVLRSRVGGVCCMLLSCCVECL